jgi:hypothetical protein
MTAILDICKVTDTVVNEGGGNSGNTNTGTSTDYYFKTTHGVYIADSDIANATGITAEGEDEDWSDFPLTSVAELLRAEIIHDIKVRVGSTAGGSSNGATTTYIKGLHYADSKSDTVEGALAQLTWPVGKGSGGKIQNVFTPRRVVSRR